MARPNRYKSMVTETTPTPTQALIRRILHPRSIAVLGASEDEGKWGGRIMGYLRRHPVNGALYPINPKGGTIFGYPAYASVKDCPGPVDMAVLLLPRDAAIEAVRDCAAKGVHSVVAITAGFAEAGEAGRKAQEELVAAARAGGTRIIGPNCVGLLNTHYPVAANTTIVMGTERELPRGPIGIVTQSGALMGLMLARGVDIGAGFSSTISVGNQCDLDINDFLEYMVGDPLTEVICLYVEQAPDPVRFTRLIREARIAGKPVLVVKAGRTAAGAEAVNSHTASLAGPYAVFEAACRAQGAYLFESPFDMLQGAVALTRKVRMTSNAVAVLSGSGGGNALLVDQLEAAGLTLARLTEDSRRKLVPFLGEAGAVLPADLAPISAMSVSSSPLPEVFDVIMNDPNVGAGIMFMTTQPNMDFVARTVQAAGMRTSKPLLFLQGASNPGQVARELMKQTGYGYVESTHDAIAVLKSLNDQRRYPVAHEEPPAGGSSVKLPEGYLHEAHSRKLLEAHGIPTSRWQHAQTAVDALDAARHIGYPVALKAVSSVVVHKSDHGLVRVQIANESSLRATFAEVRASMDKLHAPWEGVIVTEMISVDFELIAGVKVDPGFGPMVLVGAGGVLVEVMRDTRIAQAPVNLAQARAMVSSLQCLPLLNGFRGRAGLPTDALEQVLVHLSRLAWELKDQILEIDINPIALSGGRLVALDARASIRASA